jgi:hypothetical protein
LFLDRSHNSTHPRDSRRYHERNDEGQAAASGARLAIVTCFAWRLSVGYPTFPPENLTAVHKSRLICENQAEHALFPWNGAAQSAPASPRQSSYWETVLLGGLAHAVSARAATKAHRAIHLNDGPRCMTHHGARNFRLSGRFSKSPPCEICLDFISSTSRPSNAWPSRPSLATL